LGRQIQFFLGAITLDDVVTGQVRGRAVELPSRTVGAEPVA
jgi:hypothetical protein